MWRRAILWQASLLLVSCSLDVRYYSQKRFYPQNRQIECFDYPEWGASRYTRGVSGGWIHRTKSPAAVIFDSDSYIAPSFVNNHLFSRRFDLYQSKEDVVKEHAKLVQDINSLKQALFVAPLVDKNRDYDDSIYLEAIETTTTTTPQPITSSYISSMRNQGSSIPVVLVGGASQRSVIKSQPLKFSRPTVSLVGTSVSPVVRHPYPFVMHSSSTPPVLICMPSTSTSTTVYSKPKPNLLQRILKGIVSR